MEGKMKVMGIFPNNPFQSTPPRSLRQDSASNASLDFVLRLHCVFILRFGW
jgi:hypothetical protein